MSDCINQTNLEEIVKKSLADYKKWHDDNYDYDTYEEQNPYGDTWATTSIEITDESLRACNEDFKDNFDVYEFVNEFLKENVDFTSYIEEMVRKGN